MKFVKKVVNNKKIILIGFFVVALICALLQTGVRVNYNIVDYLPQNAPSTIALEKMEQEFTESIPNARVFIPDISIVEALNYKQKLSAVSGVISILWLDDVINIYEPIEMADPEVVEAWYQNDSALFSLTVNE